MAGIIKVHTCLIESTLSDDSFMIVIGFRRHNEHPKLSWNFGILKSAGIKYGVYEIPTKCGGL